MKKKGYTRRKPSEEQLLTLLRKIDKGKVSLTLDERASAEAMKHENGIHFFDTSNKWRIGIYVDCGKFDYIDSMQHGGTKVEYWQLGKFYPKVKKFALKYREDNLGQKVWGIEAKTYAGL